MGEGMEEPGLASVLMLATGVVIAAAVVGILHVFAARLGEEKAFHDIKVEALTVRRNYELRIEALRRARSGEEMVLDASDIVDEEDTDGVVNAREAPAARPARRAA